MKIDIDKERDYEDDREEMDGEYEIDAAPSDGRPLAINKKTRGRPKAVGVSGPTNRTNSYRHMDNKIPKRHNRKPNREVESMEHDSMPPLRHLPDGSGRFTGFNMPSQVTERFDRLGFKLGFFTYGPQIREYTAHGWLPVMLSEVPEISLTVIPIPGLFNEDLREYFIYREHMLMKISLDDWEEYSRDFETQKVNNERIIKNSTGVRTGERKHGLVMEYGRGN